jgi:hypothetical protein
VHDNSYVVAAGDKGCVADYLRVVWDGRGISETPAIVRELYQVVKMGALLATPDILL